MTENEILVKTLAYRYKFKDNPSSLQDLSGLFYPYNRNGVDYYMVGRNNLQQFYLGVDDYDNLLKLEETDHYDEATEQHNYSSKSTKVHSKDIGHIGHW